MQAVPNRSQEANGWSCSSQMSHPRRFSYDCVSNSYRLWRV